MFDNVALNVVIGLVLIYLLYSLFATVLSEIIATKIGLRARNLKEAIDRMLNDENDAESKFFLFRLWDSLKLMKNPKNPRVTNFYNHPEIKYLGSTGIFKVPSQFKSISFSKTLLNLLNEAALRKEKAGTTRMRDPDEGDMKDIDVTEVTKERITIALDAIIAEHKAGDGKKDMIILDHETAKYILSMWKESYGDLVKFKLHLEAWFERTMEQCLEWYKRKIQIILLVLGFLIAWFFNADTFTIIHKLSTDRDAREKMVMLAAAYNENKNQHPGAPQSNIPPQKIDSLLDVKEKLEEDITNANSMLGLGGWLPDSTKVYFDARKGKKVYNPLVDEESLSGKHKLITAGKISFTTSDKWCYFLRLFYHHFFGFLITAIAISLGAPFWFDLLNKLMKLRTSVKQPTDSPNTMAGGVSPLNREA